jgi:hypothetical protein
MTFIYKCDFCNVTKLKVLLQMHSSLDEHLYEINYTIPDTEPWPTFFLTFLKKIKTINKNHIEVFIVTSKKQGNSIIKSKVG